MFKEIYFPSWKIRGDESFEMLLLQQLSEMWHNENFHIIDTFFFAFYTRQPRGRRKKKNIHPCMA